MDRTLQEWAAARVNELPGALLTHPFGPEIDVYRVREKMFMAHSDATGVPTVTLKAKPADAEVLRSAYPAIIPGWHMNKRHWITLNPDGTLPRQLVEDLVTESYLLIVESLPRAQRPVDPSTFGQSQTAEQPPANPENSHRAG